jgi:hypothetical protein
LRGAIKKGLRFCSAETLPLGNAFRCCGGDPAVPDQSDARAHVNRAALAMSLARFCGFYILFRSLGLCTTNGTKIATLFGTPVAQSRGFCGRQGQTSRSIRSQMMWRVIRPSAAVQ